MCIYLFIMKSQKAMDLRFSRTLKLINIKKYLWKLPNVLFVIRNMMKNYSSSYIF